MKKLLAALVTAVFALTAMPAVAAERESGKKMEKKDEKKKDRKKDEKKSGQTPGKPGYDQTKNKKS